jgi:hypothetical protein
MGIERRILRFFFTFVLVALPVSVFSQAQECPGPNKQNHQDGNYKFTYESWVKKSPSDQSFTFGRCVQNYVAERSMYVKWENTGVEGYAKPYGGKGHYVSNEIPSETDKSKFIKASLWYGIRPDKVEAPYREIDEKPTGKVSMQSRAIMSLPVIPNDEKSLVPVLFEFISSVIRSGDRYEYLYQVRDRENSRAIGVLWRSKTITEALIRADKRQPFFITSDGFKVSVFNSSPPEYRIVPVDFFDKQLKVRVGGAQTAVYLPVGSD